MLKASAKNAEALFFVFLLLKHTDIKKKYFILFYSKSQIVFEHQYDSAGTSSSINQLLIIRFEVSGDKYVKINKWGKFISVYNINHSLLKNISYASFPQTTNNNPTILYLSELLFNTDSLIEYMYLYTNSSGISYTSIYREDGVLLFNDTAAPTVQVNFAEQQYPIYNTTTGTKMILSYSNGRAKVFSLGGTLTTAIDKTSHSFAINMGNAYPNPTTNATNIPYTLPQGINNGELVFYNTQGTEVKRFKIDNTFSSLLISTADIAAGTYYYQMQTGGYEGKLAELEGKLKLAEEKNQRAMSMAQQTKSGNVYIISNIGSFGEDVYKIGMTRRLEPLDRIKELGDASVPFEFDVHTMIYTEDAPGFERSLHKKFLRLQMNWTYPMLSVHFDGHNEVSSALKSWRQYFSEIP